jgi:NTE family protein
MAEQQRRVGLVLAGAGARGAYEAGALAALLPRLEAAQQRPRVLLGTSAGSINAAYLATQLHLGAEPAARGLLDFWRTLDKSRLLGPLALTAVPALLGYAGRIVYLPTGSGSIASFGRFPEVLDEAVGDWGRIEANIDADEFDAVGVVATAAATGGSVVFTQQSSGVELPPLDEVKGISYVGARIRTEHVIASSSIPVFFPAKHVDEPAEARGWYWDGGTRLNTPIAPALAMGVDALLIVATDPPRHPTADQMGEGPRPDFDDAALSVLQAALDDPFIEDLQALVRVNSLVSASGQQELDGRRRYEYLFAGPERHGTIGRTAAMVLRERYGGPLRALSDFAILDRLLGRQGSDQAELQSYLLFDTDFIERLIAMGRADGEAAWRRGWLSDRLP